MSTEEIIARDRSRFRAVVALSSNLAKRGKFRQAAVTAQIASLHAGYNHHGSFIDAELESLLQSIGRNTAGASGSKQLDRKSGARVRVLHVLTAAKDVGGDSRFVWRWIQRKSECEYSVAVTEQKHFEVPVTIRDGVQASGGKIHILDSGKADLLTRAARLRRAALEADVVFLHVYVEDVVPTMAFFDREGLPPVVYVMQADHQFFVGLTASDLTVHMRQSGVLLSTSRRGVRADKDTWLPIPLDPVANRGSREAARQALGLPQDAVVLLSIARGVKYNPISGPSFAEAATPVLLKHPKARLIVIGPDHKGQWVTGHERTGGRIQAMGQRSDTRLFYEAADIYIDSFPFASNTSLMEAGSFGLPLITYFPYSAAADVLGAGTPGIDPDMIRVHTLAEYASTLSRLIEDPDLRHDLGQRTRERIAAEHSGKRWLDYLDELMRKAAATRAGESVSDGHPAEGQSELDYLLSGLYRGPVTLGSAINRFTRDLPYFERLSLLRQFLAIDRSFPFGLFLPHWLEKRISPLMRGWRRIPLLGRMLSAPPGQAVRT